MSLNANKFRFAHFTFDKGEQVLSKNGKPVPITPKAIHLLSVLVESRGKIVEKETLLRAVWPDTFVEESNLTFTIRQLRKILGDDKSDPKFIETIPRRGYRFVAEVTENADPIPLPGTKGVNSEKLRQGRQVLIGLSAIVLLGMFGLAFVWFRGDTPGTAGSQPTSLTNSGKVTIAAVTPDGRSVVFAKKEAVGESLWSRELTTKTEKQLLPPEAVEFVGLSVSPSSDLVYYSVFANNAVASNFSRIPLEGGTPEPLSEIASDVSVSFSPDGKKFAYTESHSARRETLLRTADADGTNSKTLVTLKGEKRIFPVFRSAPVAWSSDGAEIACAVQETDENGTFFKILLVNVNDGSERYLHDRRWSFVEHIVWKDDEHLAIVNNETNSPGRQIWLISRKTGDARRLNNAPRVYEWLTAANGKLFAVERNVHSSLYISDFPEDLGQPQTKQILNETGVIDNIDWPANDRIFYNSWASGSNEIWHIDPDGTAAKQLTSNSNLIAGFAVSAKDGKIVFAALMKGRSSLFVAEPDGRVIRQLTDGINDAFPRFMPDGSEVIFQQGFLSKATLWRVVTDDADVPPRQLTGYLALQPSISPDGRSMAYQFMDFNSDNKSWRLAVMDTATRRLVNTIDFPFLITERKVVWRPGDDLLTMTFRNGENSGFLFLSPIDNSYRTIENVAKEKISDFAWSPDGKRLVFTGNQEDSDAVLVDEFL